MQSLRNAIADAPRPVIVAAAAVGGAVLLLGAFRWLSRRRRTTAWLAPPKPPSLFGSMLRSALISAVSALASRVVSRLPLPAAESPTPSGASTRASTLQGIG